jgi:hypothetical protein
MFAPLHRLIRYCGKLLTGFGIATYFVILNEVRNLIGLNAGKERFLGALRASE